MILIHTSLCTKYQVHTVFLYFYGQYSIRGVVRFHSRFLSETNYEGPRAERVGGDHARSDAYTAKCWA